ARLLEAKQDEQDQAMSQERRSQVRTADRSERIRTYNFNENRVTDHRIGYTVHRLGEILEGDLDDLVDALAANERTETLVGPVS
ncbi:MAG: peptide chain release factor 1, partial [Actinobacteria bacterium]|nr:peptide chain release factor 1 [Actinomycetota bacterium]